MRRQPAARPAIPRRTCDPGRAQQICAPCGRSSAEAAARRTNTGHLLKWVRTSDHPVGNLSLRSRSTHESRSRPPCILESDTETKKSHRCPCSPQRGQLTPKGSGFAVCRSRSLRLAFLEDSEAGTDSNSFKRGQALSFAVCALKGADRTGQESEQSGLGSRPHARRRGRRARKNPRPPSHRGSERGSRVTLRLAIHQQSGHTPSSVAALTWIATLRLHRPSDHRL